MTQEANRDSFYDALNKLGKPVRLSDCHSKMKWPPQGVYFFFEEGEYRKGSRNAHRVVRVGINRINAGIKGKNLWRRLRTHRGTEKRGGNHRTSAFRDLVGNALMPNNPSPKLKYWSMRRKEIARETNEDITKKMQAIRKAEESHEMDVSNYLRDTLLLVVSVPDEQGSTTNRDYIEGTSIALLSDYANPDTDSRRKKWLGSDCSYEAVRRSGLWNREYVIPVENPYYPEDPDFLKCFRRYVEDTDPLFQG